MWIPTHSSSSIFWVVANWSTKRGRRRTNVPLEAAKMLNWFHFNAQPARSNFVLPIGDKYNTNVPWNQKKRQEQWALSRYQSKWNEKWEQWQLDFSHQKCYWWLVDCPYLCCKYMINSKRITLEIFLLLFPDIGVFHCRPSRTRPLRLSLSLVRDPISLPNAHTSEWFFHIFCSTWNFPIRVVFKLNHPLSSWSCATFGHGLGLGCASPRKPRRPDLYRIGARSQKCHQ